MVFLSRDLLGRYRNKESAQKDPDVDIYLVCSRWRCYPLEDSRPTAGLPRGLLLFSPRARHSIPGMPGATSTCKMLFGVWPKFWSKTKQNMDTGR